MTNKLKQPTPSAGPLMFNAAGALPLWDDTQIQQENWGGPLALPARGPGAMVELCNVEEHAMNAMDEGQKHAFKEALLSVCGTTLTNVVVNWRRPIDVFAPFRPIVHRNMTPFLFPYDNDRKIFDGKAAEEAVKSAAMLTGKRGDTKLTTTQSPLHRQFPEIVQVLEPQALEAAVKEWEGLPNRKAIQRYREMQPLMQAYDPFLKRGCAETPVDACEMSYTTAVRHRLKEVEEISKLSEPPPFVMDAFNTALRFIEHAESFIRAGEYLWELVYPHAPGTCHPVYNPNGKYVVKLFFGGAFRRVVIDDYLPVDVLGRPFFSFTSQREIWPALLAKALFVAMRSSCHLLFTDPEIIVSCLRGGWIAQRIDPRIKPAAACALLLKYRKVLLKGDADMADCLFFAKDTSACSAERESCISASENKGNACEGEVAGDTACAFQSHQKTISVSTVDEDATDTSRCPALCAITSLFGERRKLFVIRNIAIFKNELALQIFTNPPVSFIKANELVEESKDEMVQKLLHCSSLNDTKLGSCSASLASNSTLWVTFREFSAYLDLLVWHNFDEESHFCFCSRLAGAEDASSVQSHAKKKGVLSGSANGVSVSHRRHTIKWIHLVSDKTEELAIVSPSIFSCSSSMVTQKNVLQSTSLASQPASVYSLPRSTDSKRLREDLRGFFLDLYTWERGDAFSSIGTFTYEPGKPHCVVQTLPAGSHIIRLTAVGLESPHALVVLATQNFVMGDEKDVLSSANIYKMSDAGTYSAVERANEEVLWFKRLITVKEPTMISFVVSTLEPTDDPANHRDIPAILLKDVKGTKARVVSSKTQHKENPVDETQFRFPDIPTMSYCRILLIDLDKGTSCTGAIGRLVCKQLEPNQQGYLVMAYILISSMHAILLEKALDSVNFEASVRQREIATNASNDDREDVDLRDIHTSLCGKGLWKLTISADRLLDSYKLIPHNVFFFVDEGQLRRGSNALLCAYMCTIFERTYITLLLNLDARDQIPLFIKVTRVGAEAQPVFVSDACTKHIFIPHITLDLAEKSKKGNYIIEAWLDEAKVQEWEERRRLAQEMRFRALRSNNKKAMERCRKDSDDKKIESSAFISRAEQHTVLQAENNGGSTVKDTLSVHSKKIRANNERNKSNQGGVESERQKNIPLASSMATLEPNTLFLDATDEDLIVTFNVRMQSSSKMEVKNAALPKDPLLSLRAAWLSPNEHLNMEHGTSCVSRTGGTRGKQRDMTTFSMEELMKADQGRVSRQCFLDNPHNLLIQNQVVTTDERPASSREAVQIGTPRDHSALPCGSPRPTTDLLREVSYFHAPILSESQYRVQPLPIRATEIQPPLQQTPPNSSSAALQSRLKSPNDRFITRVGTLTPLLDEDGDVAELKALFQELLRRQLEDLKQEFNKRAECREAIKNALRQYWAERRGDTPPLLLLGSKEDENVKRKGRMKISN